MELNDLAMRILEQHQSPDGLLRFIVVRHDDEDISLGFDGFAWHTHADILASEGQTEEEAVRRFVDDLLCGRSIIAVARVDGRIQDVWIADVAIPDKYKSANETIEFRRWDGAKVAQGRIKPSAESRVLVASKSNDGC